ncbi:MAG: chalcone isomerase family protein [Burkholderiaceae bacterium]
MNRNRFAVNASRLLFGWILGVTVLTAALAAGSVPPLHIQNEVPQARLAGQGNFRWLGLKIYEAQLWVGDQGVVANTPLTGKLVLDLRYARSLQGAKIAASSQEEMQKLGLGTAQQRANWQSSMEKLFPDVKNGTHLSGVFLPDEGARFYLDGKLIGEIRDAEFGRAFFAIWLDAGTSAPSLRKALLVDAAPR